MFKLCIFSCVLLVAVLTLQGGGVLAQNVPLVCTTPPQRAELLDIANGVANIVDSSLKLAIPAFKDPAKRAVYTNVVSGIISALKNGWAAPNVCDAIANPIADPLAFIPVYGPGIQGVVKSGVIRICHLRQLALGCPVV